MHLKCQYTHEYAKSASNEISFKKVDDGQNVKKRSLISELSEVVAEEEKNVIVDDAENKKVSVNCRKGMYMKLTSKVVNSP